MMMPDGWPRIWYWNSPEPVGDEHLTRFGSWLARRWPVIEVKLIPISVWTAPGVFAGHKLFPAVHCVVWLASRHGRRRQDGRIVWKWDSRGREYAL
ncbi:MAG: hypothetical protein SFW09_13395 [Hyphomicrobiaceae bacterium]|nr:hypothetical protein [Hyphomicrobiaceae bacterium]